MEIKLTKDQIERVKCVLRKEVEANYIFKQIKNICKTCKKSKICSPHNRYGIVAMQCGCYITRIGIIKLDGEKEAHDEK